MLYWQVCLPRLVFMPPWHRLLLYAIFGTSRALAVGPVAVASLMTAAAAGKLASQGTPEYLGAAIALAMVSGLFLIAMGFLKLGFLANFLSHPVIAGFITASGLQIAAGQLGPVLGIKLHGETFLDIAIALWHELSHIHIITAAIGVGSLIFLFWVRNGLKPLLIRFGMGTKIADHPCQGRTSRGYYCHDPHCSGPEIWMKRGRHCR